MTYEPPEQETHPSYGVIRISRQSGYRSLFQSSMNHQHSISIRIHRACISHCTSGMDNVWPEEELIEILLTEAQFARAITSMNMSSGSPCTISHIGMKTIEQPEIKEIKDPNIREIHKAADAKMKQARDVVSQLDKFIDEKKRPTLKEMDELRNSLNNSIEYFKTNYQFYVDTFKEKMEHIVSDAKTEVEAHIQAVISQAGMQTIAEQFPRLTDQSKGIEQ